MLRLLPIVVFPAVLVGCRSGYDVDVRNQTDAPITARLQIPHTDGAPQTLREAYVGIGDTGHLFIQRDSREPVTLVVDAKGDLAPASVDLTRGATTVTVRRNSEPGQGRLALEAAPRP
jgi:hypothetical protein